MKNLRNMNKGLKEWLGNVVTGLCVVLAVKLQGLYLIGLVALIAVIALVYVGMMIYENVQDSK